MFRAARCSKHVEERSITYIFLKNKRIVHYVGNLKSLYYDARSEKYKKNLQSKLHLQCQSSFLPTNAPFINHIEC